MYVSSYDTWEYFHSWPHWWAVRMALLVRNQRKKVAGVGIEPTAKGL